MCQNLSQDCQHQSQHPCLHHRASASLRPSLEFWLMLQAILRKDYKIMMLKYSERRFFGWLDYWKSRNVFYINSWLKCDILLFLHIITKCQGQSGENRFRWSKWPGPHDTVVNWKARTIPRSPGSRLWPFSRNGHSWFILLLQCLYHW